MQTKRKFLATVGVGILILSGGAIWYKAMATEASLNNNQTSIGLVQAVETVLAANPGTTAVDATLVHENNALVWEVKLNNDLEISVLLGLWLKLYLGIHFVLTIGAETLARRYISLAYHQIPRRAEISIDANTNQIVRTEQGWNLADVPFLGTWVPIE
jgi:hypothetical protein